MWAFNHEHPLGSADAEGAQEAVSTLWEDDPWDVRRPRVAGMVRAPFTLLALIVVVLPDA